MQSPVHIRFKKLIAILMVMLSVTLSSSRSQVTQAQVTDSQTYIPLVMKRYSTQPPLRINAPYFSGEIPFEQTAIAWFGELSETSNFTDIRVGYNNDELFIYLAVFDRRLWYDINPTPQTLTQWDSITVMIDTTNSNTLSSSSWRFVAQLYGDSRPESQAVYRGSNSTWQLVSVPFQAQPGWRGNALNDDGNDRGWAMGFTIPFDSLGITTPPVGTLWRLGIITHDRDSSTSPPSAEQSWQKDLEINDPQSWGVLHFGLPIYNPSATPQGSVSIRRPTESDPSVPDADLGGASSRQCPGDEYEIWNQWPNRNFGGSPDFNIQNQSDIADWPCFSRYYVSFPLDALPLGKEIISAMLTLHQFGNAGGVGLAQPSWIQVLMTYTAWQEYTITWNNAPIASENIGGSWINPVQSVNWPGIPRTWDVTYAVAKAYEAGQPVLLILYEADSAYHSGKYFVSSDTGDWNTEGRPRLDITWGE